MLPSSIVNLYEFTNPEELHSKIAMICSINSAEGFYIQRLFLLRSGIFMQMKNTDGKDNIHALSPVVFI